MTHVCRHCSRAFGTELALELHLDTCGADDLQCGKCGARFAESGATRDGWHYECPEDDCDGAGIGEDLRKVGATRAQ
jgi:hypothetical protein